MEMKNLYKEILKQNIFRLLNLYNTDIFSATYGFGDRDYWGWKIKDFSNATMQGGVHSLAIALKLGIFKKDERKVILKLIETIIKATKKITHSNGSVDEAYPKESSFCVSALVSFDILSALYYLKDEEIEINNYFSTVEPLINFITKHNEEHAIGSNHLATAVSAILLWNHLTGDNNQRYKELLQVIYENQSSEGWYREYEGADPGYQTLCTHYLFYAYMLTKDKELFESLKRSARFLMHFIHPDGTIGGLYGSRNTEVFYPGGIVGLSGEIEEFALMAKYLVPDERQILPQHIDIGNFVPLLNSYAVAALYYESVKDNIENCKLKPFWSEEGHRDFPESGIYIYSNRRYFVIINYKKGGTLKIFDKESLKVYEDGGIFGILKNGRKFSTQAFDQKISFRDFIVVSNFYLVNEDYLTPLKCIVVRILGLTVFKFIKLNNMFKKMVVKRLMTGKKKIDGRAIRKFIFAEDKLIVEEKIKLPKNTKWIGHAGKCKAIHMASSGYFNKQLFKIDSTLVEFRRKK